MSKVDFDAELSMIQTEYGRVSNTWFAFVHSFPGIEGTGETEEEAKLDLISKILDFMDRRTQEIMSRYMNDESLDGDDDKSATT